MVSFELSTRWEAGSVRLHGRGALGAASIWQEIGQFPVSIRRLLFNYLPIKSKPQTEAFELFFIKWPLLRNTSVLCSREIFVACFGDPLSCTLCCNGEYDVYSVTQYAFEWSVDIQIDHFRVSPSLSHKASLRRNLCYGNRSFCRYGGYFNFYCCERHYGMLRRKDIMGCLEGKLIRMCPLSIPQQLYETIEIKSCRICGLLVIISIWMETDIHKKDFASEAMILTVMTAILAKLRGEAWKIQDLTGFGPVTSRFQASLRNC